MSITQDIVTDVISETVRADAKFGNQYDVPDGTGAEWQRREANLARMTCQSAFRAGDGSWMAILHEEVAEAFAEPSEASSPTASSAGSAARRPASREVSREHPQDRRDLLLWRDVHDRHRLRAVRHRRGGRVAQGSPAPRRPAAHHPPAPCARREEAVSERDDPQHEAVIVMLYDHAGYTIGHQYLCNCQAVGTRQDSPAGAIRDHFTHLMDADVRPKELTT